MKVNYARKFSDAERVAIMKGMTNGAVNDCEAPRKVVQAFMSDAIGEKLERMGFQGSGAEALADLPSVSAPQGGDE